MPANSIGNHDLQALYQANGNLTIFAVVCPGVVSFEAIFIQEHARSEGKWNPMLTFVGFSLIRVPIEIHGEILLHL